MNLSLGEWPKPGRINAAACAMAFAFALAALVLCTRTNEFPSSYHPDEPAKARQVIERDYNFHHPMLMLTAASLAAKAGGAGDSIQRVTVAGRWVSAGFTSAAIFCLVLTTCACFGLPAGAVAGLLLVTNHQLFELAHYFKEDPAVLLGISALFLALVLYDRAPGSARAALLGAAAGLAASGKFIGILAAPLGIAMIVIHCRERDRVRQLALWFLAAAAVFALANLPIFLNPGGFAGGFERELGMAVAGHKGITRSVPHGVYGAVFRESTNPIIWALLIIYAVTVIVRWRSLRAVEWMLVLFPIVFTLVLSFSPKTHHRYFLPVTGLLLCLAGAGAAALPAFRWKSLPVIGRVPAWAAISAAALVALAVQAPRFFAYYDGFSHDGRSVMAAYLRAHVPPGTTIVQDKRVDLDALDLPYKFEGKLFAADVATLDELRARGIRYVAVAEGDYGRFFRENLRPSEAEAGEYSRRKRFYDQLFREGTRVLDCEPGTLQYLQPHIALYEIQ